MPILESKTLTRRYYNLAAMEAHKLAIEPGEGFSPLGPTGAVKTSTIQMLTALLPPSLDSAKMAGFEILHQAKDVRRSNHGSTHSAMKRMRCVP